MAFAMVGAVARAQDDEARFDISAYRIEGATLAPTDELERAASPHAGPGRTFADIERARAAVQALFAARGYGAVQVVVPEQEVTGGAVVLRVIEARIARVEVGGNAHFSESNVRRSLPQLVEGTSPNTRALSRSLALANENPARQSIVTLSTAAPGTVDARVTVKDEKPWRFTLGADNSGNDQSGRGRVSLSYRHANLFDRDHQLVMQYITAPGHVSDVSIFGLAYRVPLYGLGDSVQFSYARSSVTAASVAGFDLTGRGESAGLRYVHNLDPRGAYSHYLSAGMDWRDYRSGVRANAIGLSLKSDLGVRPFMLGYSGAWRTQANQLGFSVNVVRNVPGGAHGGDADFEANRAGARAAYTLYRYGGWYNHVFTSNWSLLASLSGQYSRDVLVPVEYFGIGGTESVRGFFEREAGGDTGHRVGLEVFTPDLAPRLGMDRSGLRLSWFIDAGRIKRRNALPEEIDSIDIASTGLSLRYSFARTGHFRIDVAHVLDGGGLRRNGSQRVHASLSWSY